MKQYLDDYVEDLQTLMAAIVIIAAFAVIGGVFFLSNGSQQYASITPVPQPAISTTTLSTSTISQEMTPPSSSALVSKLASPSAILTKECYLEAQDVAAGIPVNVPKTVNDTCPAPS